MAGAISGTTMAAIAAMVAGAAMQYKAQQDAASRQRQQIQSELQRQQDYQKQAEKVALDRVQDYDPEQRQNRQQQIEQQVTDDLLQPVQQAQPGMQAQSAVQGSVSQDYTAARAQSQAEQMKSAEALARIMGKITGANRLRQDEALNMMATGQQIDRLKNFSQGSQGVGQLEAQLAGTPDGGLTLAGSLAQTLGSVGLMGGFSGASTAGGASSAGTTADVWAGQAPKVGANFTNGGLGFKAPASFGWP
ncbi:hypothetical protein [Herbaspirillum chlorophenolicum]|uniref:hypothetical protein n=1 Tax=Herbaspirillum chlorophenolicum TaxID=211589 RepID=UPI00067E5212|nr:hypothetical protein [Herbaspirillum chlorophenolicum]